MKTTRKLALPLHPDVAFSDEHLLLNSAASQAAAKGATKSDTMGGEPMHCGEPMKMVEPELTRLFSDSSTEAATADAGVPDSGLAAYLQTRVRRCACGFQMELPFQPQTGKEPPLRQPHVELHGL
ncbi:hypothetical protein AHiyo6_19270 [Arthrobacter sp. Hiyo6]|nr:hypothetical protein AHiyo6_19270 [Arthrobacter sp. Hiyo6]